MTGLNVVVTATAEAIPAFAQLFGFVTEAGGQLAELKQATAKTAKQVEVVGKDAKLALDRAESLTDVVDGLGNKVSKVSGTATSALSTATAAGATAAAAAASAAALAAQVATIVATVASAAMVFTLANELRRAINNAREELNRAVDYLYRQMEVNQINSIKRDQALGERISEIASRQGSLERELAVLQAETARIKAAADALGKTVIGISTEVGTLSRVVRTTSIQTAANTRSITALQTQTATLTKTVTATQTQVATLTRTVTQIKTEVATQTRTITQVKNQVVTITQIVTELRSKQVSIVRVPVPYTVTNTITRVIEKAVPVTVTNTVTNNNTILRSNTITNNNTTTRIIEKVVPVTNTITKTDVKVVPVTNTITNNKLSNEDLTKIKTKAKEASCEALSGCNPDSQRIQEINNKLGVPFATPATLLNDGNDAPIEHLTFASLFSWWIRQMDMLVGEFPIKLQIEDSDLMQVGDQPLNITIPNMAECLAELLGNSINNKAVTEANLDASMRTLMEAGSGRKQAIVNHYLMAAIQDYLGFSSRQKIINVPFTYNPIDAVQNDKISEALNPSEQKVKVEENADMDTLEKQLKALLEAARIIKAVHVRKLAPENVENWKQMMRGSRDQIDQDRPDGEENTFDQFLANVEDGWGAELASDPSRPYDRNFNERPKTRRLNSGDPNA